MIQESNFRNAYKEVYTILKYVEDDDLALVPKEFIDMLKKNMNGEYEFKFDPNIRLEEQQILMETKCILSYLFMHYWANEKQKLAIEKIFKDDIIKEEEEKKQRYLAQDLFHKKTQKQIQHIENVQVIKYKESIFKKIIGKIKRILHIN